MPNVYLCCATNSTMFTTCCNTAICDDEKNCPKCKQEINQRTRNERWSYAYGRFKNKNK